MLGGIFESMVDIRRISNIFVIGEGVKPWVSLPKGKGTKLTIAEERDQRRKRATEA